MEQSSLATARMQIAAAFLEPALRFARLAGLSLDELQELTTEGYFRELQRQGMSWTAIARRMGKSRTTVSSLAKRAGTKTPPLERSERFAIQRSVVLVLADGASKDVEELIESLSQFRATQVSEVLQMLVEEQMLVRDGERVRIASAMLDILGDGFEERLASLRHLLEGVAQAAFERFFATSDRPRAFARVLTFLARKEDGYARAAEVYETLEGVVIDEDGLATELGSADQTTEASAVMVFSEKPTASTW